MASLRPCVAIIALAAAATGSPAGRADGFPDLVVVDAHLDHFLQQAAVWSVTFRNDGTVPVGPVMFGMEVTGGNGGFGTLETVLDPGESFEFTPGLFLFDPICNGVFAVADPADFVAESNEANNVRVAEGFTGDGSPHLMPVTSHQNVVPGQSDFYNVTIVNRLCDARAFALGVELFAPGWSARVRQPEISLEAGQRGSFEVAVTADLVVRNPGKPISFLVTATDVADAAHRGTAPLTARIGL